MADQTTIAFIGVGSNVDPETNIVAALASLREKAVVTGISTFYRTVPLDRPEQPSFLNGVFRIQTDRDARDLKFDILRKIEKHLGRVRTEDKYAARSIDLDILLYGQAVMDEPDLRIPDPDIRTRSFIAVPLLELEPDLMLPGGGGRLSAIVEGMDRSSLEPAEALTQRLRSGSGLKEF